MAKKKSLQKFTDLEKIKTAKQTKDFLVKNPQRNKELRTFLLDKLNLSYKNKLGEDYDINKMIIECLKQINDKDAIKYHKNSVYESNHTLISTAMHNYILNTGAFPNPTAIAEKTGLSRTTIHKHLKNGLRTKHSDLVNGKLEVMRFSALESLYSIGVKNNNPTALMHFLKLSNLETPNKQTNINNYIQINNLKITKDEFNQLPTETILEIETLITKNITSK